jgi:RHS repeat-associated protein
MVIQSPKNKWLIYPYSPAIGEGNVTYGYNARKNRLSSVADASLTYDSEGQLAIDNSGKTYTFDYEHRLKTIGADTTFFYDGRGNRLKANRAGVETRYIYDGAGRLLAEANSSNQITKYYIYGNGLLATVTSDGQTYCYHFNGVGSTIAMTNSALAIVNKYSYDAFGNMDAQQENILNNDTKLLNQPFKYVGQYGVMAEPNGFYYMKARYYDPTVGRFISEDPSGLGGGDVNLTAYVGNNPVTGIDPSGLCRTSSDIFTDGLITAFTSFNWGKLGDDISEVIMSGFSVLNPEGAIFKWKPNGMYYGTSEAARNALAMAQDVKSLGKLTSGIYTVGGLLYGAYSSGKFFLSGNSLGGWQESGATVTSAGSAFVAGAVGGPAIIPAAVGVFGYFGYKYYFNSTLNRPAFEGF